MVPPAPLLQGVTLLAFAVHIGAGALALLAGVVAVFALKGGRLHRRAGAIFVVSMLTMAVFAVYLAVVRPGQQPNIIIGAMTFYLVATAWLTVSRERHRVAEAIAFGVILCLCAPFAALSVALAARLPLPFKSAVALDGPVLVAIYGFTLVTGIAAIADARVLLAGQLAGARRIERHLWRMCFGLTLAAGSAFTNGLPRLLPKGAQPPEWLLFVPQLSVLGLLAFWLVRVRLTGWNPKWVSRTQAAGERTLGERQVAA
jgi:uncharacterized membrane protein